MKTEDQPLDEATPADAPLPETTEDELAALEDALLEGKEPETPETEQVEDSEPEEVQEPDLKGEEEPAKTEAQPEPEPETEEPAPTPEGMMPYGAYAAEKSKAREYKAELEELRKFKQETESRQAVEAQLAKPEPLPDQLTDPDGFNKRYGDDFQSVKQEVLLLRAEMQAEREFGYEAVQAAQKAVQEIAPNRPDIQARLIHAQNPHSEAVRIHREMERLSEDPDAMKARIIEEYEAGKAASDPNSAAPQATPAQQPTNPPLPPNIAGAPSAAAANIEPSFDDIENEAFGWG